MWKIIKLILSFLLKSNPTPDQKPIPTIDPPKPEKKPEPTPSAVEILTFDAVATSSGRYPERVRSPEFTPEIEGNINKLLPPVNAMLRNLGVSRVEVTSGFRTSASNSSTPNAAKKSNHMLGLAVDILDDENQTLGKKITLELLEKYNLYMEDLSATIGKNTNWVHLQVVKTKSGRRVFKP